MPLLTEPAIPQASELPGGTVEERLALIERVASSAAFSKSVRLRDFLRYVGQRAARPAAPEVHEQEIGEKVFGRRKDYDRSQDNIVRVNASELRRRVDAYFASEGADESIVFSIPRGSYLPVFRPRSAFIEPEHHDSDPAIIIPALPPAVRRSPIPHWLLLSLLFLFAAACALLLWQNSRLRRDARGLVSRPAVDAFWSPMIDGSRQTDIVLPDDSLSVEEEMTGKRISLRDYTDRNFLHLLDPGQLSPDHANDVQLVLSHNLVTLGGVYAAVHIHDLAPHSSSMRLAWARLYSADSMKQDNVVLVGGAKANPWVDLFEDQLNFKFDYNNPYRSLYIQNRHPQPGELQSFRADANSNELAGYAVVAFLPNPSNSGSVVLLLGSDSDATNAAAEYLTSEDSLNKLLQTFHRPSFPHFELLLKVSRVRGTSLTTGMIAYRTYP
jgi:hypothetical protein